MALDLVAREERRLASMPYDPFLPLTLDDPRDDVEGYLRELARVLSKMVLASTMQSVRNLRVQAPREPWAEECVAFLKEAAMLRRWKNHGLLTWVLNHLSEVPLPQFTTI